MSRDARETKMHYTPSDKDGVFVVEVSRGADSKGAPPSPRNENDNNDKLRTCKINIEKTSSNIDKMLEANEFKSSNHEEVQIHQPPSDGIIGSNNNEEILIDVNERNLSSNLNEIDNENNVERKLGNSNIGLSQSDLSTSSEDSNKGYTYGNQQLYEINGRYDDETNLTDTVLSSPLNAVTSTNGKLENDHCNSNGNDTISNHNDDDDDNNSSTKNLENDSNETKPIIKSALLKQDTVIEITNSIKNPKIQTNNKDIKNGEYETHSMNGRVSPIQNNNDDLNNDGIETNNIENGFDSIISLPEPPSTEEIKQMNDVILSESTQLDSLPPPPPLPTDLQENSNQNENIINVTTTTSTSVQHEGQNGVAIVAVSGSS